MSANLRETETTIGVNRPYDFSAIKCNYPNCEPPPNKDEIKPNDTRKDPYYLWDNTTMWNKTADGFISNSAGVTGSYGIPKDDDSVKIMPGNIYQF